MLRIFKVFVLILTISNVCTAYDDDLFNIDFFCGWDKYYRPMEWMPIEIGIQSDLTEIFEGSINISAQQDSLNKLNVVYEFVLSPDIPIKLPLVTKIAFSADRCNISITDKRNRTQWSNSYNLQDYSLANRLMIAVNQNDFLIGLVGRGKFNLYNLPKDSYCLSSNSSVYNRNQNNGQVYIGEKIPEMTPWDWTGFASLDLLILYDPDWDMLNEHQINAITQWISNGGKLLLVLGKNPLPGDNSLTRLLPFEFNQAKELRLTTNSLARLGLNSNKEETVISHSISIASDVDEQIYENEIYNLNECIFATGCVGFGRVGVLSFDPSVLSPEQNNNATEFWVLRIKEILEGNITKSSSELMQKLRNNELNRTINHNVDIEDNVNRNQSIYYYEVALPHMAINAIMEHLYDIRQMRPLSIWWVILILGALAFLLGPIDYKILKRIDKLPLTWLTCTFWIILFTVGAYYGVQTLRAGKTQFRMVSVIDGFENNPNIWSTNYCVLFASKSDEYRLNNLNINHWWSGIAPSEIQLYARGQTLGGGNISCIQHDGGNLPSSLPVNIWTMQGLMNESAIEQLPFNADIKIDGDRVIVDIDNKSKSDILSGYVLMDNNQGIEFGMVSGQTNIQFSERPHQLRMWEGFEKNRYQNIYYSSGNTIRFKNEDAFFAQGCSQRTQSMMDYIDRGAAVICVEYKQDFTPFFVEDPSCEYDHLQLARIVVFPKMN